MEEIIEEKINQKSTPKKVKHALYKEYHSQPLQMNKVVCSNFHGKGYGCNPKYIVEALRRKNADLDIVWLVSGKHELPEGVRAVEFNSKEALNEIATARVLIDNQMKFVGFKKRKDQFFIETWHGAIPLKKIGYDNPSNKGNKKYDERVKLNFSNIDVITSNSKFCTDMFRRSFTYEGAVLQEGYPRNDLFMEDQQKYKDKVCELLGIPKNKKLFLYAPTFRSGKALDAYQMDYHKVLDALGEDWVVLIRLHPHVQSKSGSLVEYTDRIINASKYDDMQELMAGSDILVTDYSNIMFEFAVSKRPCFLYATDIEAYRKERDYYFEIYNLPFPVATTTDELIDRIKKFDEGKYNKKFEKFKKKVKLNETGKAADKIADVIINMTSNENFKLEDVSEFRYPGDDKENIFEKLLALFRK